MTITIAIDSFKGSLSSAAAGKAASRGIRRVYPDADIRVRPLADGGEGTLDALCTGLGGTKRTVSVSDPLGRRIDCEYAICPNNVRPNDIRPSDVCPNDVCPSAVCPSAVCPSDVCPSDVCLSDVCQNDIRPCDSSFGDRLAVIEMSAAAGLTLLSPDERDPLVTTTYGVGELIADALGLGIRDFIVGIGGSATNDGGAGMLSALGFGLYDRDGNAIPHGARGLEVLAYIDRTTALPELRHCRFRVACDVMNPLCGENGCSAVFSPQKGAKPDDIPKMDEWLMRFARLAKNVIPDCDPDYPGSGAAGGLGFALHSFLGASLVSGVELVLDVTRLEDDIAKSDLLVTGEGRLDSQTAMGKAPAGAARLAAKHNVPCIALAGSIGDGASACHDAGIDAYFPILRRVCTLDEAMKPEIAAENLADTVEEIFRLIRAVRQ